MVTTIRASTKIDHISYPKGQPKALDYNSLQIKQKCYQCGGDVAVRFQHAEGGHGHQDVAYEFTCGNCGLEEFDDMNAIDPADEENEYAGYESSARCAAAWKKWFLACLQDLVNDGKLPRWLQDI